MRYPTSGNDSAGVYAQRTEVFRSSQSPDELGNALWGIMIADKDNDGLPPPVGTVIKFVKFHEIRHGDVKEIKPLAPTMNDMKQARADAAAINVVPNPYYGEAVTPTGLAKHRIRFTHLPAKANVRIFNLAGNLVKILLKDDPSQFLEWNLQNEHSLPVGSGVYIAYIELPEFSITKTLKFIVIQGRENLNGF
jgi:hypothetical protein